MVDVRLASSKLMERPWAGTCLMFACTTMSIAVLATPSAARPRHAHPIFANPPMIVSRKGRLDVDLVAAPATYAIDDHRFQGMLYNGRYIPAIWRVRPGDQLNVALHNRLDEETNLHFHGLDVSPRDNGDNVYLHIPPGQTFDYQVTIPDRHVGLFWFHPHMHGEVDEQIIGGLSGAILVEGSDRAYPFVRGLSERILLFKHHPIGRPDYEELVTVNGMVAPDIPIRPREAQLWQLANIGADRFLDVGIDGLPLYVIGRDGYFAEHPVKMNTVLLGPGQRVEAIVVCNQPGRHAVESVLFRFDVAAPPLPQVSLGTLVCKGPPASVDAVESRILDQRAHGLYADAVRASPIAQRRTFAFSRNPEKTEFYINSQTFDENRTDVTVRLGDTEEWTILNQDTQYHDFHIHQTGFLVTEINGRPATAIDPYDGLRDTFSVPPMVDGRPGEMQAIIPFTNPAIVGRFVFHCHVAKHEDKGMMMSIEVEQPEMPAR
jgi:FtsP/CotA-like multicopper oxidase with cupredoxin domain